MKDCPARAPRVILHLLAILSCSIALFACSPGETPKTKTEYQAVLLDNGQAFFGKLTDAGPRYVLLNDVYYIQSNQDPATKQINVVLTKRGNELHAPDVMYINNSHIIVIESVTPGSKVAQLIQESKAKK